MVVPTDGGNRRLLLWTQKLTIREEVSNDDPGYHQHVHFLSSDSLQCMHGRRSVLRFVYSLVVEDALSATLDRCRFTRLRSQQLKLLHLLPLTPSHLNRLDRPASTLSTIGSKDCSTPYTR